MRFVLPWPPSVNNSTTVARGRKIKTAKAREWFSVAVAKVFLVVRMKGSGVRGRFSAHLVAYPPDRRIRDLDNLIKPCLDALVQGGAIEADHLSQRILIEWADEPPKKPGHIEVVVMEV